MPEGTRERGRKKEREVEKVWVGKKILFLVGGSRYGLSRFLLLPPAPLLSPSPPFLSLLSSSTLSAVRSSVPPSRIRSKGHRIRAIG